MASIGHFGSSCGRHYAALTVLGEEYRVVLAAGEAPGAPASILLSPNAAALLPSPAERGALAAV